MVKPTVIQKILGRPSQRYSTPGTTHDTCHRQDVHAHGRRGTLVLRHSEGTDDLFFTPASSPPHSTQHFPSTTPPASATSLSDAIPPSTSLPDHSSPKMTLRSDRKLMYTDEDWAKDVRWLVAPRSDNQKLKSKQTKRRSAPPSTHIPTSRSTPSPRPPLPHPPPPRSPKAKGIGKAKISTARSVVGMSALLEVEEDLDPDLPLSYTHAAPTPPKHTVSRSPDRSPDVYHKPRVSSPLRSSKVSRQRSFSSPSLLLAGDQAPIPSTAAYSASSFLAPGTINPVSHLPTTASHSVASTSKSPYTSPPPNVLDALAAHVTVSDPHDTLPSTGTRGYTKLVLPHAASSPSLAPDHGPHRVWKIGRVRPGATVRDNIGIGFGLGDQIDLPRARLAQTTMASIEIVRGIAASSGTNRKSHKSRGSVFGVAWFSKDKPSATAKDKNYQSDKESPLGFTAYRAPPVYVGAGFVLVQVWGVGLDGMDARLTGIHPPRPSSSLAGAPYGSKGPKSNEKDKGRGPPVGYIPGRSFVGRVLEVGWEVGVDVAKRGDWVVGLMSVHKCGALAEFILADRHRIHRVPNPFIHLKHPFVFVPPTQISNEAGTGVPRSPTLPPPIKESLTVDELALLPLCGVPAYRAVRTFHQITQRMGKSRLAYDNSHHELHPILPPRGDTHDFTAGGDQEDAAAQALPCDSRPRALILRAHDGAGALSAQMLACEGWSVWAHVPVPFTLPGAYLELPDELRDEEEEREFDNQRNILRRIEDRLRGWGVDEVIFVPVTSMPLSTLFDVSNTALEAMSSWSSPSMQSTRSPSSSPSISPSPFSRSTTSTPLSSPYSHGFSSGHLSSSSPSSSSHQNAFTTPYSFTALPLSPYDCEQGSIVSLLSYLTRSRVRLDAILDTIGGREIWDAGRQLLSRPVRDPSRQGVDAQFTTLVGDAPDRVVSTAGDNFRAGVRALLGGAKDQHPFEDSGYHDAMTNGNGKDKKAKARPVNYSWVNVVSDVDWEGSDVHDTLCAVVRMASSEGLKPVICPPDFANAGRRSKGKKRATSTVDGIDERLLGKVLPFESTPDAFLPGGNLEYGGTTVSRVAA